MEAVTIVIPTRNRWEQLKRTMKNLKEVHCPDMKIVIVCDGDKETYKRADVLYGEEAKIYLIERSEYVKTTRFGIEKADTEFIVFYSDDFKMDKNCLKIAMKYFLENFKDGLGVIKFNDKFNEKVATVGLTTKKTIELLDAFNPEYKHYYVDTEIGFRAEKQGIFKYLKEAVCEHLHWSANKSEKDQTYNESEKLLKDDRATYIKRGNY